MTIAHTSCINSEIIACEELVEVPPSKPTSGESSLEYTGERMVPEANLGQVIYVEHLTRYMFAAQFAGGKTVLDFGSGEGYGAAFLADHGAIAVHGIDVSHVAVEHARIKYSQKSVNFVCGNCLCTPFEDKFFDLITSFEVIEHLTDHAGYIGEACRLLKENGTLIISTPNILKSDGNNHFHLKELTLDTFIGLLHAHFTNVRVFAQTNLICSMVYDTSDRTNSSFNLRTMSALPDEPESDYFVAVCSNRETRISANNTCVASSDGESPRLNTIISETREALKASSQAVEDHVAIIREKENFLVEKDRLLNSLIIERGSHLTVITQYMDLMACIKNALACLRNEVISVECCLELAQMCMTANLSDSARSFFSQILKQEPDHTVALFQMGQLYYRSGKPGLAKEYLKRVLQYDSHHTESLALMADIDGLTCPS